MPGVEEQLGNARRALAHAKNIIRNYEHDIATRAGGNYADRIPDLVELGFCQGTVYRHALADLNRLEAGDDF